MTGPRAETVIRALAVLLYVGLVPLALADARVPWGFWQIGVVGIPLALVAGGFHLWRRLCPLALFGQLGRLIGRPGRRKAGPALERAYPLVQLGLLGALLALRRLSLDASPAGLALLLGGLAAAAAAVGLVYTGKTWCNFFCPVGILEKIYTEPVRPGAGSSQCTHCTACKKSCPDIDLELGYWKELELPARRLAYHAFPGLTAGFFALGRWPVDQALVVPVLLGSALASVALGLAGEAVAVRLSAARLGTARLGEGRGLVRHRALALSAFAGLVLFYGLAAPAWLAAIALAVATVILVRRWDRREDTYVKETLARGLLRRWSGEWGAPPARLADVYLVGTERQRQRERRLSAYKETLVEMIDDGVVSRNEVALLGTLRAQLGIADADHERAVADLSAEERRLFDPAYQGSVERRLMLEQLARDLEQLAYAGPPEPAALEALRVERGVSPEDWDRALAALRAPGGALAERLQGAIDRAQLLRRAQRLGGAERATSRTAAFFHDLCAWQLEQHVRRVKATLAAAGDRAASSLDAPLPADDAADRDALVALVRDASPHLRAGAAHVLSRLPGAEARVAVMDAAADVHPLVRETAVRALAASGGLSPDLAARALGDPDPRVVAAATRVTRPGAAFATLDRDADLETLSTFEVMTLLHDVPLFSGLSADDLEALSGLTRERRILPGEDLCVEGDAGRDVFVLVSGRARAWVHAGAERRVLGEPGPGACIGEMAALDDAPRTATVTALTEVRAVVLPGADFKELLEARPPIAREVLRVLSQRLRGMIGQTVRTAS